MSKPVRRIVAKSGRKVLGLKDHRPHLEAAQRQLAIQEQHIANLENDLKLRSGSVYTPKTPEPRILLIANQLDASGAPLVFMDLVKDFPTQQPKAPLEFHAFQPVNSRYEAELKKLGLPVIIHDRRDIEMRFNKGDVVVLNTVAHTETLKKSIYEALAQGTIKKLIWYMHEDWPEVFFSKQERQTINHLITNHKLVIYIPAAKALANHQKAYAVKEGIVKLPYRFTVDSKYQQQREAAEFDKLTFIMVGKTGEGLKGHLPILYAFLDFKRRYYDANPEAYRDFELQFVAIEADYLSLQILHHGAKLGKRFKHFPPLPHDQTLDVIKRANVTICYSLRECLPMYVYEGMIMGHPILRNDTSGMEEQLKPGKNGFLLDSNDFYQVVDTIEQVLNKATTSNQQLALMSTESYGIANQMSDNSYESLISATWDSFIT